MRNLCLRRCRLAVFAALWAFIGQLTLWGQSEEKPDWKVEFEESSVLMFVGDNWFKKDYGWLYTARVQTPSKNLLLPIIHVEFIGYNAEEEQIWSKRQLLRKRDFDGRLNGTSSVFMRALLKDIPPGVELMTIGYAEEPDQAGDE